MELYITYKTIILYGPANNSNNSNNSNSDSNNNSDNNNNSKNTNNKKNTNNSNNSNNSNNKKNCLFVVYTSGPPSPRACPPSRRPRARPPVG